MVRCSFIYSSLLDLNFHAFCNGYQDWLMGSLCSYFIRSGALRGSMAPRVDFVPSFNLSRLRLSSVSQPQYFAVHVGARCGSSTGHGKRRRTTPNQVPFLKHHPIRQSRSTKKQGRRDSASSASHNSDIASSAPGVASARRHCAPAHAYQHPAASTNFPTRFLIRIRAAFSCCARA